jgi:DNA ligase (NAD+)
MNIIKKINNSEDQIETISKLTNDELEQAITIASDSYYNKEPVITDGIYDILIDFLTVNNPKSKVLKNIGAKVKNKIKLDYWLGSMTKIKSNTNQLDNWNKKHESSVNISDKLDGVSALLVYTNDEKIKLFTRGDGIDGTDITGLVKYLELPDYETIKKYCSKNKIKGDKNLIAFRGELIIKESIFKKNWAAKLKNARNSVSGLVNSKKINPKLVKDTDLLLYEVVDPFYPINKQLDIIGDLDFNIVPNETVNVKLTFEYLSKYLKERREKSEYQIDGIIITSTKKHERNIKDNPEYAFAYKDIIEDQIAKTTVVDIEWNVSKDGYIKPTVILEPVNIGGVEIKRVTGFNAKFINDNKIGIGAKLEIIRSGDVIPYIKSVIKTAKVKLPEGTWNETNVDLISNDLKSKEILAKNIYHFFSALDTKGLGEKNVEKMVIANYDSILKIIQAKDFLDVEGFKEKTSSNIVAAIKKALTNINLAKLMGASNKLGHGLGERKMQQVLDIYPNLIKDHLKWTKKEFTDKIIEINGWDDKTAILLVSNFSIFIKFYDSIKPYISLEEKKTIKSNKLNDIIFVFTGFRDKESEIKIVSQGGKVGSSVSKNTNYLVIKDDTVESTKIDKAKEIGVKIITKEQLIKLLS